MLHLDLNRAGILEWGWIYYLFAKPGFDRIVPFIYFVIILINRIVDYMWDAGQPGHVASSSFNGNLFLLVKNIVQFYVQFYHFSFQGCACAQSQLPTASLGSSTAGICGWGWVCVMISEI